MIKNNNLFLKIIFVIISVSFTLWYVSLLKSFPDGRWTSLIVHAFFLLILKDILKKVYVKKLGEDNISKYGFSILLVFSIILLGMGNFTKRPDVKKHNILMLNKINSMLDTCNYYEAKLYGNAILFKPKGDKSDYLASSTIKPYVKFELLNNNAKYEYLISSFIKCPKDSSELVYIFDEEGTISVILKLKNSNNAQLKDFKSYLGEFKDL